MSNNKTHTRQPISTHKLTKRLTGLANRHAALESRLTECMETTVSRANCAAEILRIKNQKCTLKNQMQATEALIAANAAAEAAAATKVTPATTASIEEELDPPATNIRPLSAARPIFKESVAA